TSAFNNSYTIEACVYNLANEPYETVFATASRASAGVPYAYWDELRLSLNNGVPTFNVWDSSSEWWDVVAASSAVPVGQWVHLAATMSLTNDNNPPNLMTTVFVNGQPVASKEISYEVRSVLNRYMTVGRSVSGDGASPFNGYVDDVRVYSLALPPNVIQAYMYLQDNETIDPTYYPYQVSNYKMDSGGSYAVDSRVGNTGIFAGPVDWAFFGAPLAYSTSQSIGPLAPGTTYHYRARLNSGTSVVATGADATFTTSGPRLNPLVNITISKDSVNNVVRLSGIGDVDGYHSAFVVSASSSNPSVVPVPSISYFYPSPAGSMLVTPAPNATGTAVITVQVADTEGDYNTP